MRHLTRLALMLSLLIGSAAACLAEDGAAKSGDAINLDGIRSSPAGAPAASQHIERRVEQPAERLLDRVEQEAGERRLGDTLFGPADEIESVRIGWYINDTGTAFEKAIDLNVPFVLFVHGDWCDYCWHLVDALTCPGVNRFAGSAVFAVASPEAERFASAVAGSLNIGAYPTITVLFPEARMLIEGGRISGYFSGDDLASHFATIFSTFTSESMATRYQAEALTPPPFIRAWALKPAGSQAKAVMWPLSKSPERKSRCVH